MSSSVKAGSPAPANSIVLDTLTLMAIGVVAFILKNVLHEALGHGGVCLLVGGVPLTLSTAHFDCGTDLVSDGGVRLIAAGGTLVNFIASFVFWLLFRNTAEKSPTLRYFFWLGMSGNFFVAAGYPLFSGVLNVGDWVSVVDGWQPAWVWRILLIVVGLALYLVGVWFALREMSSLIGAHPTERLTRAFKLSFIPYIAGSIASTIGALLNPLGSFVFFTSAAAAFGGNSALAWMTQLLKRWFPERSEKFVTIERDWRWIGLAVVLVLIHVIVLGPSVQFK